MGSGISRKDFERSLIEQEQALLRIVGLRAKFAAKAKMADNQKSKKHYHHRCCQLGRRLRQLTKLYKKNLREYERQYKYVGEREEGAGKGDS